MGDTELVSNPRAKNPRRVAAGRANRNRRGPPTAAGRERLRLAALRSRPWESATGPVSAAGKAVAAANGRARQVGPVSVRQARGEARALAAWFDGLARLQPDPAAP